MSKLSLKEIYIHIYIYIYKYMYLFIFIYYVDIYTHKSTSIKSTCKLSVCISKSLRWLIK